MAPGRRRTLFVGAPLALRGSNGKLRTRFFDPDLLRRVQKHLGPDIAPDDLVLHALELYLDQEDDRRDYAPRRRTS